MEIIKLLRPITGSISCTDSIWFRGTCFYAFFMYITLSWESIQSGPSYTYLYRVMRSEIVFLPQEKLRVLS